MCVQVCKDSFVEFIVAPVEADMQVGCRYAEDCAPDFLAVHMGRDADLFGYGARVVVIVDSCHKEDIRIFDIRLELIEELAASYPLYKYYVRYGPKVFR